METSDVIKLKEGIKEALKNGLGVRLMLYFPRNHKQGSY